MVPHEVVGGARDGHADFQELELEFAQVPLAAAVRVRDDRADDDTPGDCGFERLFELRAIESKDDDVDRFLGTADSLHERREAVVRLNDEFYFFSFLSPQFTAPWPSGSRARMASVIGSVSLSSGTFTS